MSTAFAGVDFARGRLFDTADADEAREVCGRVFNPHRLRVLGHGQRLRARMDHLPSGGVSINRLTWGAAVEVDPDRLGHYYLLSVPVAGSACFRLDGRAFDVSPRCAAIVNSAQRFHFEASAEFDQICVRFERPAVEAAWQALAGVAATAPIHFAVPVPVRSPAWRALEPVLALLARCTHGAYAPQALPHVQARVEEMLLTTLLLHQVPAWAASGTAHGSRCGNVARAAASPSAHLRRAQAHMRDRLEEPLTLAAVARAGGVAARTLQAAFQAHCGMGPMQWLREQRLHAVREALAGASDGGTRVTDTALRFGFTHLGEFSRAYRLRFGEAPRETLARRG
ncbi:MAG: AraC family transcriptional regulator [Burkholderiales bacterium]|nr:AraC family transcriptional regulator [Burkholderiales bacterium]